MKKILTMGLLAASTAWAADDGLVRNMLGEPVTTYGGECVQAYWVMSDLRTACHNRAAAPVADATFDTDQSVIKKSDALEIKAAAEEIKKVGEPVTVTGSADYTGTEEHNKHLSLRRAEAAKRVLVRSGVKSSKVTVQGAGVAVARENSACAELTGAALARCLESDRRVDIKVQAR